MMVSESFRLRLVVNDFGDAVAHSCGGCGGPKINAGRGSSYCGECKAARIELAEYQELCQRCGVNKKKPGIGQRLCTDCVPHHRYPGVPHAVCIICKELKPKPPGRGTRICIGCQQLALELRQAKLRARKVVRRKPCITCGRTKGINRMKYCEACATTRANAKMLCSGCGVNPRRKPHAKYCFECHAYSQKRNRARANARSKRNHKNSSSKPYTVAQRLRDNENRRMNNRLKAQAEGRSFNVNMSLGKTKAAPRSSVPTRVPAKPIALTVRYEASRRGYTFEEYCSWLGVPSRSVTRWQKGERISLHKLDKLLFEMDLFWWEVYDPERWTAVYTPLEWIDVVDQVSFSFAGERLIGPDACNCPRSDMRVAA